MLGQGAAGQVAQRGVALLLDNPQECENLNGSLPQRSPQSCALNSILCIPVKDHRQKVVGVIEVTQTSVIKNTSNCWSK